MQCGRRAGVGRNWQLDEPSSFSKSRYNHHNGNDLELAEMKCRTFAGVGKNRQLDGPSRFQEARDDHHNGIDPELLRSRTLQLDKPCGLGHSDKDHRNATDLEVAESAVQNNHWSWQVAQYKAITGLDRNWQLDEPNRLEQNQGRTPQ